jgi:hypothetical protein
MKISAKALCLRIYCAWGFSLRIPVRVDNLFMSSAGDIKEFNSSGVGTVFVTVAPNTKHSIEDHSSS